MTKVDLSSIFAAADMKNRDYSINNTTIAPIVMIRWLTGNTNGQQIVILNEFVNCYVFPLYKHPDLLWKLFTASTSNVKCRYKWIKLQKKKPSKPIATNLLIDHYHYSQQQALDVIDLLTIDDFVDIADQQGWQKEEITKLKRELVGK